MRKLVGISLVVLTAYFASVLPAQDSGLFSGSGFKSGFGSTEASNSKTGTSAFSFYKGDKADQASPESSGFRFPKLELPKLKVPKWEMPKLFQGERFPSPIQLSDSESKGVFGGFPKFDKFATRDPAQPNFFQRMNDRTKQLFGRTKDNVNNAVLGVDKSANATWDRITKGNNGSANRNQPPLQPNLRSARQPNDGSSTRNY